MGSILSEDPALGKEVLGLWWVSDDMPTVEAYALANIRDLARSSVAMARQAIAQPFMGPPFRYRDQYALKVLASLSSDEPEIQALSAQLSDQPWFSDGLDDLDAAVLHVVYHSQNDFRNALLESHYAASMPTTLPSTGDVELVVVRHTPFAPNDHTLATMEEGLVAIEGFMEAPFPVRDIILLVADPDIWSVGGRNVSQILGGHMIVHMVVNDEESGPGRQTIFHEIAHYYYLSGPRWLREGTANFFETYVLDRTGNESIEERRERLESDSGCDKDNIQQHIDDWAANQCDYDLGERFLLAMYANLGSKVMSAALRDLHARSMRLEYLSEDVIYHAFLSNTPRQSEKAFKMAYRRYHGGPIADTVLANAPDLPALVALYEATNGEEWLRNSDWLSNAPMGAWHGVTTEPGGRVWELSLSRNSLAGEIPPELESLSHLQNLFLARNSLVGDIPASLGGLSELRWLNLGGNHLTGEIPPEFGKLAKLWVLGLWENRLTGHIPPELGGLGSLVFLHLTLNQLTGEIPRELANLTALKQLDLAENLLTGTIPTELGSLANLNWLNLGGNSLVGEIPSELGRLQNLETLRLWNNRLSGRIPSELGGLPKLLSLELTNNRLSGTIPGELGHLENLRVLRLGDNQLSGEIPSELGRLKNLWALDLRNNQLSGPIPSELGSLSNLGRLFLGGNGLTGCIPQGLRGTAENDLHTLGLPYCDSP